MSVIKSAIQDNLKNVEETISDPKTNGLQRTQLYGMQMNMLCMLAITEAVEKIIAKCRGRQK